MIFASYKAKDVLNYLKVTIGVNVCTLYWTSYVMSVVFSS